MKKFDTVYLSVNNNINQHVCKDIVKGCKKLTREAFNKVYTNASKEINELGQLLPKVVETTKLW